MSLTVNNILSTQFVTGTSGNGSKSVPGLKVGDIPIFLYDSTTAPQSGNIGPIFESSISVDDHIQQVGGGDLTATTWAIIVRRQIST